MVPHRCLEWKACLETRLNILHHRLATLLRNTLILDTQALHQLPRQLSLVTHQTGLLATHRCQTPLLLLTDKYLVKKFSNLIID